MGHAVPLDFAVVAVGPATVRAIQCGVERSAPDHLVEAALSGIDDEHVIIGDSPVLVAEVWREVLGALIRGSVDLAVVVCPSWWSPRRAAVVLDAVRPLAAEVRTWARPCALAAASVGGASVVVELAEHLVVVSRPGPERGARLGAVIPRHSARPAEVAGAVAEAVGALHAGWAPVVIDRADGKTGAEELAAMVAGALRGLVVTTLGDDRVLRAVVESSRCPPRFAPEDIPEPGSRHRKQRWVVSAGAAAVIVSAGAAGLRGPHDRPVTTQLTEGRVAVTVPATWTAYRVTGEPGSARVQVSSPTDPEAALHITQSSVGPEETLALTADALRRALEHEPPGVFVEFRPDDRRANRAAVTYREIRASHHVRWALVIDGTLRIGIGCQSAPGREDSVRGPCELAVASAHELMGTSPLMPPSN